MAYFVKNHCSKIFAAALIGIISLNLMTGCGDDVTYQAAILPSNSVTTAAALQTTNLVIVTHAVPFPANTPLGNSSTVSSVTASILPQTAAFATTTETPDSTVAIPTFNLTPSSKTALPIVPATPLPTANLTLIQPTLTDSLSPNRKLSSDEQAALTKLVGDLQDLNASMGRVDALMTDTRPDEPAWNAKIGQEIDYWQKLLAYYKTSPMPDRVGSLAMPLWLAALAHLNRAGQLLLPAYQQANGIEVSQTDQEIADAELQLGRVNTIIKTLQQKQ